MNPRGIHHTFPCRDMTDRVLVIGSGETEEGLCRAVAQSAHVKQVLFAPGTERMPDSEKMGKSAVLTSNPAILKQFCKDHNISLVVISSMSLLAAGKYLCILYIGGTVVGELLYGATLMAG
ncbi:trifunctional purine biosynthetic protein adenosine-3-like [Bufo gargarizans]|uniref:trifunctional purine biosynthetic protein adenosine-3-like n=1 Tax=Bufo gargarizans TaxID=30331 RepID=UPI001CF30C4C|nr:trifunctional purine biosynthetic protein adenosine-3-like [Bufo gargarizans]